MDEAFVIDIVFEGVAYSFEARLATTGYTHRFHVIINGIEVAYEPDEERNYRAIIEVVRHAAITDKDRGLIVAVGEKIQTAG